MGRGSYRECRTVIFWEKQLRALQWVPLLLAELQWGEQSEESQVRRAKPSQIKNYQVHLSSIFYSCDMLIPSFILENDLVILTSRITLWFQSSRTRQQWKICSLLWQGKITARAKSTGCPCSRGQLLLTPCCLPPRREVDCISHD